MSTYTISERTVTTYEGDTLGVRVERIFDSGTIEAPTIRFYWIIPGRVSKIDRLRLQPEDIKGNSWWSATPAYYDLDTFAEAAAEGIDLGDEVGTIDSETVVFVSAWAEDSVNRAGVGRKRELPPGKAACPICNKVGSKTQLAKHLRSCTQGRP